MEERGKREYEGVWGEGDGGGTETGKLRPLPLSTRIKDLRAPAVEASANSRALLINYVQPSSLTHRDKHYFQTIL